MFRKLKELTDAILQAKETWESLLQTIPNYSPDCERCGHKIEWQYCQASLLISGRNLSNMNTVFNLCEEGISVRLAIGFMIFVVVGIALESQKLKISSGKEDKL